MLREVRSQALEAQLLLDVPQVSAIRLLASSTVRGDYPKFQSLADGSSNTLLYEVSLRPGDDRFAAVDISINDRSAYLPILGGVKEIRSLESQTATTLARFARWHNSSNSSESSLEELLKISADARVLLTKVTETRTRIALDHILIAAERKK